MAGVKEKVVRSEKRIRRRKVETRMTEEEYAQLMKMANIANVHPQDVIRSLVMKLKLKPVRLYPEETYRQIAALSNNVNQIAKKLNSGAVPSPEEISKCRHEVQDLIQCLYSK